MGSRVARSTGRTSDEHRSATCIPCAIPALSTIPLSVISANVRLALRCRSMFWLYTSVLKAFSGSPEKKSVSARCGFLCQRVRSLSFTLPKSWRKLKSEIGPMLAYIFEVVEEVGHCFPLRVGESIFVVYLSTSCMGMMSVRFMSAGAQPLEVLDRRPKAITYRRSNKTNSGTGRSSLGRRRHEQHAIAQVHRRRMASRLSTRPPGIWWTAMRSASRGQVEIVRVRV